MEHPAQCEPGLATVLTAAVSDAGIARADLARDLNTTTHALDQMLSGRGRVSISDFLTIAHAVGTKPSVLMARAEAT